jgi:Asparagine synthase (glutamine-hydrolyzing)
VIGLGFQRLSIMGLTEAGMQPFELDGNYAICNGELYGFKKVREELKADGYKSSSDSDCEIILPMYRKYGTESLICLMQNMQWLFTTRMQMIC